MSLQGLAGERIGICRNPAEQKQTKYLLQGEVSWAAASTAGVWLPTQSRGHSVLPLVLDRLKEGGGRGGVDFADFLRCFIASLQPKKGGGISFNSTVTLTQCSEKLVQLILHEYSILS